MAEGLISRISTDVYGYPMEAVVWFAIRDVRAAVSGSASARPDTAADMDIIFCCFSERDKRICKTIVDS